MDRISVIVPTKDRPQLVIECLESILAQTLLPDEILIVDSSDTEELNLEIKRSYGENDTIKYIHSEPGLTYQRNVGIKASSGDIVIFFDDDVILDRDYVKEIANVFNDYLGEKIGGVTGNVVIIKRGLIKSFLRFGQQVLLTIFFMMRYGKGHFQASGNATIIRNSDKITECEFLYGCNMAFRKDVISQFMFDESLHAYAWGEDDDVAYRVSRRYENIFTPFAKLVHKCAPSMGGNRYAVMKMTIENNYYLFKKNFPQDFEHKFAFWWSVVGLFVMEILTGVIIGVNKRNTKGVKGLLKGVRSIYLKRNEEIGDRCGKVFI